MTDSRVSLPELTALAVVLDGAIELRSPTVGLWRGAPRAGTLVAAGAVIGDIEVLGVLHRLRAPGEAHGIVVAEAPAPGLARIPVGFGDRLLVLDVEGAAFTHPTSAAATAAQTGSGLALRAPSSGRFYARAAPDKPPFVTVGDLVETGRVVALLEVMKTFHRIVYGGEGLPPRARIVRVVPEDGADLEVGDPMLELEPA